jgi:hypothetical protein
MHPACRSIEVREIVMGQEDTSRFRSQDIARANIDQLIGLSQMAIADGVVTQEEADVLHKFLIRASTTPHPVIATLLKRTSDFLADGVLDAEEAKELLSLLASIAEGDIEVGDVAKPAALPLCDPAPKVEFPNNRFYFVGTFLFGNRKDCEDATSEVGGEAGDFTENTNYLVIGRYVTDAWKNEAFGQKIESAIEQRAAEGRPHIISEDCWAAALESALSGRT